MDHETRRAKEIAAKIARAREIAAKIAPPFVALATFHERAIKVLRQLRAETQAAQREADKHGPMLSELRTSEPPFFEEERRGAARNASIAADNDFAFMHVGRLLGVYLKVQRYYLEALTAFLTDLGMTFDAEGRPASAALPHLKRAVTSFYAALCVHELSGERVAGKVARVCEVFAEQAGGGANFRRTVDRWLRDEKRKSKDERRMEIYLAVEEEHKAMFAAGAEHSVKPKKSKKATRTIAPPQRSRSNARRRKS